MKQILIPDCYSEINQKKADKIIDWIKKRLDNNCMTISYDDCITKIVFQKKREFREFCKLFMDKELLRWNNEERN